MGIKLKLSVVHTEETLEEKYKKQKRKTTIVIFLFLFTVLGFIIYELKFSEKGIFNKGDKYEEYDPNYPLNSDSNIEHSRKKETNNVVEGITSNIIVLDDKSNTNINSNSNSQSNKNIKSNTTINAKDTTKPSISGITTKVDNYNITVTSIDASDNITSLNNLKKEYSIDNKKWQTLNTFGSLTPNQQYTIYVRVTDDVGNISSTYVKNVTTTYTPVPNNVSGTYVNGSEYIYVYGGNVYIIFNYKNDYKYLDIKSTNNVSKLYEDKSLSVTVYGDRLTIGNVTYTKKEATEQSKALDDMFDRMYGGTYFNEYCNGIYTTDYGTLSLIAAKKGNEVYCYGHAQTENAGNQWLKASEVSSDGVIVFKISSCGTVTFNPSNLSLLISDAGCSLNPFIDLGNGKSRILVKNKSSINKLPAVIYKTS